eukprot:TRINITY_DN1238_c0_g1_i4.p1 TRINITY_DN1238_c0_g1~~TRINITY_DN1238_c0_g1_i4.p1  ORF type:complete len:169 (-),score=42.66 TRINITY_DN1238_c0_g1_i4:141-647(-)
MESNTGSQIEDLTQYIDKNSIESLNVDSKTPTLGFLTTSGPGVMLRSDADEQLIVHYGFNQPVKIRYLHIRADEGPSAPTLLHIFTNKYAVDFDSCEQDTPTQEITLGTKELTDKAELKFVKFQNVKSITFFFKQNGGAKNTIIRELKCFGNVIQDTNMKNIKKIGDE